MALKFRRLYRMANRLPRPQRPPPSKGPLSQFYHKTDEPVYFVVVGFGLAILGKVLLGDCKVLLGDSRPNLAP